MTCRGLLINNNSSTSGVTEVGMSFSSSSSLSSSFIVWIPSTSLIESVLRLDNLLRNVHNLKG